MAIGFVMGLFIGATIGGNFFNGFTFADRRGYEAVGIAGAWLGAAIGAVVGALLGVKRATTGQEVGDTLLVSRILVPPLVVRSARRPQHPSAKTIGNSTASPAMFVHRTDTSERRS